MSVEHENIALLRSINMPAMPRPAGKGKKIAYAILGKPANMISEKGRKSEIDRRLTAQDTRLIRGVSVWQR